MEDSRSDSARGLQRCFECNRLEEQLWGVAYEQIWPVLRRSLKGSAQTQRMRRVKAKTKTVARRA